MTTYADTNVLLAFTLQDRPVQRSEVERWSRDNGRLVVSEAVLAEVCWVLVRSYGYPVREVAVRVRALLASSTFDAWDADLAESALSLLIARPTLGLPDCLLAARALRGDAVYTFDRRLATTIDEL